MGVVPPAKRGVGSGMRAMLTNTGFVLSIALSIGLMTTAMDPDVMVKIFSGTQTGAEGIGLDPFIDALHIAFFAGVIASAVGAVVSMARGGNRSWAADHPQATPPVIADAAEALIEDAEAGASI